MNEKLEGILAKVSTGVIATEYILCFNNYDSLHASVAHLHDRVRLLPMETSYFGDVPEIFIAIMGLGLASNKIEEFGKRRDNKVVEYIGKHFPAIVSTAIAAYYTLGETVLPQILPGTADVKDVPAVLITALTSMLIVNRLRKKRVLEPLKEIANIPIQN